MGRDTFANFAELATACRAGVDYRIRSRNRAARVLIMAPHGGTIEPGTSELAEAVAGEDLDLYCFEGLQTGAFKRLHLTSTHFDEPGALAIVASADAVIAVHGLAAPDESVLIGGRDLALGGGIAEALMEAGIAARQVVDGPYAGHQAENICNRGRAGRGVQLEIGRGLRDELRHRPDTKARLAAAIRRAIGSPS